MLDEAEQIGVAIPDDATLGYCWDNGNMAPVISRTMVIDGDELWSLSSEWGWNSRGAGNAPGQRPWFVRAHRPSPDR